LNMETSMDESSASKSTFRDTEIEEDLATSLLRTQNLSSIVNDPRSESMFRQLQQFVGATTEYKPLKEA